MYTVNIERHFDSAHYLREYNGKCENLHGHRYKVVATASTRTLDRVGLAFDFTVLKKKLDEIIERFDHTCLNDITPFDTINPSAENIAATIYNALKPDLEGQSVSLDSVGVWESPDAWVIYQPD